MNTLLTRIILIAFLSTFPHIYLSAIKGPGPMNGNGMPMQLSPEDIQAMEQEVTDYVNSLPEEEQKKFWQDVETTYNKMSALSPEELEHMSTMNPEELEQFMNEILTREEATQEPPKVETPITPQVPPLPREAKAPVALSPISDQNKQEAALRIIEIIISRVENLNTKIAPIMDIDTKIERWGNARIIQNWPSGTTWDAFHQEISLLVSDLKKLKSRDTRTHTYKYIDAFIQNEALYTQLAKLSTELTTHTANIEASVLGSIDVSEESKKALQNSISSLAESTYIAQVRNQLSHIFASYDTVAETIKKQEEELRKRAEREAGQKIPPSHTRVAGKSSASMAPRAGRGYSFGDDFDGEFRSEFNASSPQRSRPGQQGSPSSRKPATAGGARTGTSPADKKQPEVQKIAKDSRAENRVKIFDESLDNAVIAIQSITWIENIESHVTNAVPQFSRNDVDSIASATKSIKQSISTIKALQIRVKNLSKAQSKMYTDQVRDSFDAQSPYLSKISAAIARIDNQWNSLKGRISIPKRYAYFGARDVPFEPIKRGDTLHMDPQVEEVMKILPGAQVSLFDLRQAIDELRRTVANLQGT